MDAATTTTLEQSEIVTGIKKALRGSAGALIMSPYYLLKLFLVFFYTLPVGFFLVFSSIVLNPAIISVNRMDLFQMVFDHYEKLFQYSITVTIVISFLVITHPVFYRVFSLLRMAVVSRLFK